MRNLFVPTVTLSTNVSIASQLKGALRGQWVILNGFKARVANHVGKSVVLAFTNEMGELCLANYK